MFLVTQTGTPSWTCHCCHLTGTSWVPHLFTFYVKKIDHSKHHSCIHFHNTCRVYRSAEKSSPDTSLLFFSQKRVTYYMAHRHMSSNTSGTGNKELFPCYRPKRPCVGCRLTHTSVKWERTCWVRTKGHSALIECAQEKIIWHEKHTVRILHDLFSQVSATPGLGKIVRNWKCSEDSNKEGWTGGGHTNRKEHGAGHL